ncbi:acid-sensing ion channel 1C-like [Mytilus trossulus]|uniref:acid-sensing ion channel 1C-like n=1 Tax=Mytilus trossulus TaxID=6551 RepID=UPI003007049E
MSDQTGKQEKLTAGKIWEDFIESTGFHAVNKIDFGKKNPPGRTLFWMIIWLLSAGYLLFNVATELISYYKYPTTTTVSVKNNDELEFPAITICNLATLNKSMFTNDTRTDNYYLGISALYYNAAKINWSDPFYSSEGYFNDRTLDDLYMESKSLSKFIIFHKFDLKPFYLSYTPVATDLGLCVRFNTNSPPLKTSMHGGLYNLQMFIDLRLDDDYFPRTYVSSGLKVVVHDQSEEVLMANDGFVVPPASEALIQISRKEYKYLPPPFTAFEDDICEDKRSNYSTSQCQRQCVRDLLFQQCSCVGFMFYSPTGKYCSKERYLECFMPEMWNMFRKGYNCSCPNECQYTDYDTKLSYGLFPSAFMMKSLTTELNETEDYIKTNYISLSLFYKNLKTTITEQKPKYENVGDVFCKNLLVIIVYTCTF